MKVLFTCNVTKAGGAGHLIRSIALAEQARTSGHEVVFCGRFETEFAQKVLALRGFDMRPFNGRSEALADLAAAMSADLVHCDDYDADEDLHAFLSSRGILLSNMEDGTFGARAADFILDPSAGAERLYRSSAASATHLRGHEYVPLRASVCAAAKARTINFSRSRPIGTPFRVLLILGGTDATGSTQKMAELWAHAVPDSVCHAILPTLEERFIEQTGSCQIEWLPSSENVVSLFSEVDAAVAAAGTTAWELAAAGVPTALVTQATNQTNNYDYLVGHNAMLGMGDVEDLRERSADIQLIMKRLRAGWSPHDSSVPNAMVDLEGSQRIISEWNAQAGPRNRISIREARMSDASVLFDWRNDEQVRAVSRDNGTVSWDGHVAWLRSSLDNPQREVFVGHIGPELVGTVRYDQSKADPSSWEISIALNPAHRGRGLGTPLLAQAEALLGQMLKAPFVSRAVVRADNYASNRLFDTNGYSKDPVTDSDGFFAWCRKVS
ncbi:bifunctional UDP-2,4-diacetamido-2,4,6-trideoxy-beta-L-altropyranose hydrolase/GNAT family N-acetyltransferase [Arthrobacter sp. ISL-28]|uniref:bifunctional UDP-2,4-diacetamido-2,4,6-trideoxy-beta-L-altropyranose hydrolase/GNAT family N-acetyltransferase n=1 Tax=Arthrobacter sp. ISL-28 TaxID=2819108 RepID=UPI001BE90738|nr:bifunctional UDP-2,4-diacetamido-2,4,6-trideoxy-beta-L-altropyranose hydrolase/GNAT family N-acetyltransferase [Arthrobacter sp. ISL-28]MBT2519677.1 GNAT family N-acetyltransferase [Arthrobacter sp. ISL-28]